MDYRLALFLHIPLGLKIEPTDFLALTASDFDPHSCTEVLDRANSLSIKIYLDQNPKWLEQSRQILNESLENSPTRKFSEPWYRLVQVACGDNGAIVPALDGLC